MNVHKAFEKFVANLRIEDTATINSRYKTITKLLNRKYWDSESDTAHSLQVGSFGRGTATVGLSDLDMVMGLPWSVKTRFDEHEGNGQSALLQEVKSAIKGTYPSTDVSGDGQVVVVKMTDFTIEVLPAFENNDGSYVHADTSDGGSWEDTNPRAEIAALNELNKTTNGNLKHLCKMIRGWKNKSGTALPGILIDTLCFNFFESQKKWHTEGYGSFDGLVAAFFEYLGDQDPKQKYWLAPGSRQRVYRKASFVRKAKKAHSQCLNAIAKNENISAADLWREIFGSKFPTPAQLGDRSSTAKSLHRNTEEFIEDQVPVAIKHTLEIDCNVTQAGFRTTRLAEMLMRRWPLLRGKSLRFFVTECSVPEPYTIKWKVRNVGAKAESLDKIRGEIHVDTGGKARSEQSQFNGPHYVECYVIQSGVCVARARIDVPIVSDDT